LNGVRSSGPTVRAERARRGLARAAGVALLGAVLAGCAYEIGYRPDYVPDEAPGYIAEGRLLIIMPEAQQQFVYEGPPSSRTGDFTTLIVPLGSIVREIATDVFARCFAYGVEFVESAAGRDDYVLALAGDMEDFVYSYTRVVDAGFNAEAADVWTVPEVSISFHVRGFNKSGTLVLDKIYDSGVTAGEGYLVTSKPAERINRTLHATLHELMLKLAADVRPLLLNECRVTDVAGGA